MNLYYNGGFKADEEYIDFLLAFGYVVQKGAYFKFEHNGEQLSLQGRVKLQDWLFAHPEEYEKMKSEVDIALTTEGILDKDKKEISEDDTTDVVKEEISEDIMEEEETEDED
jgi:hypothetical protein